MRHCSELAPLKDLKAAPLPAGEEATDYPPMLVGQQVQKSVQFGNDETRDANEPFHSELKHIALMA